MTRKTTKATKTARKAKPAPLGPCYVLVSYQRHDDGRAEYVEKSTTGSIWGGTITWTLQPTEARHFKSRQTAHAFKARLGQGATADELFVQNLRAYGYQGEAKNDGRRYHYY